MLPTRTLVLKGVIASGAFRRPCAILMRVQAAFAILVCCLIHPVYASNRNQPAPISGGFPVPREIVVSIEPYTSMTDALDDIEKIDWERDPLRAKAIGLAYAARELECHLRSAGLEPRVVIHPNRAQQSKIVIALLDQELLQVSMASQQQESIDALSLGDQGYAIVPSAGQLLVTGRTRVGVLYGVYALLEQIGFAWYDPYETHIPARQELTRSREWEITCHVPSVWRRGFWIYGPQPTPDEFAVWLARNRFNLGGRPRPPLQRLLGIHGWTGEHELLQQEFSRDGLFVEHPEWFAEVGGVRRPIEREGAYFNPSFASGEAAEYFASRIIERLVWGDLQGVDILNVWPVDDRFNRFDQSAAARSLGNETDNLLFFYSNLARRIDVAYAAGKLNRKVTLAGISYFLTMQPPGNQSTLDRLKGENYLHLFYPIERDWNGRFDSGLGDRDANRSLAAAMSRWQNVATFESGVVDYHNMSSYAGVALTDHRHLSGTLEALVSPRRGLYAYMHPLLRNPGPRRLTNALLSRLLWRDLSRAGDDGWALSDHAAVAGDYFLKRYGAHAAEWQIIYDLIARSTENSKEMFGINSLSWLLLQEQIWTTPFYDATTTMAFIERYRDGGVADLPAAFSGAEFERATFRGLDASLALQAEARLRWQKVLEQALPPQIRARMLSDVEWFEATASRYRLLVATIDFLKARQAGTDTGDALARINSEIEHLSETPVTADTISPIDQRAFLTPYRKLVERPNALGGSR